MKKSKHPVKKLELKKLSISHFALSDTRKIKGGSEAGNQALSSHLITCPEMNASKVNC
jgi:hypothetical protein